MNPSIRLWNAYLLILLSGCSGAYSLTTFDGAPEDLVVIGKNHVDDPGVDVDTPAPVMGGGEVVVPPAAEVVSPIAANNDDDYAMDPIIASPPPVSSNDSDSPSVSPPVIERPPVVEVVASTDDDETGDEYCKSEDDRDHSNDKVLICHRAGKKDKGVDLLISRAGWENGHSKHEQDHLGSCADVNLQSLEHNCYKKCTK